MRLLLVAALAAIATSGTAQVARTSGSGLSSSAHAPQVAVTHHVGHFNGRKLSYTATVSEHILTDSTGRPAITVVTIAYTRDGVSDLRRRPIIFAFNGGPGASSSPLHMNALGPMRRVKVKPGDRTTAEFAENPHSPLDAADLVFIDPVSTGFSRPRAGVDPTPYYSRTGDALEVKAVIQDWLKTNHREASPRYLAGESYGTTRVGIILKNARDLPFDGALLIALVGSAPGQEMPYVVSLPTMAAGAWYHQRIDRLDRTVDDVFNEAVNFARTDYVSALIQGSSLPPAERRRVAARMSSLIGLPSDLIEQNNLRITPNTFMFNLLKPYTLRTGLLDVRVTAPLEPDAIGDLDDPALGVAPRRSPGAPPGPPPSPAAIGAVLNPAIGTYITRDLKFSTSESYVSINFLANSAWNYEDRSDATLAVAEAMKANPKMRLFWAAGYYDLTTPAYEGRYTLDQDGIPTDRLTAIYFDGPHGVYDGEDNLAAFDAAVRRFVMGSTSPSMAPDASK